MFEYSAKVVRIIDGDTIEVNIDLGFSTIIHKEKVRLLGIDTPELRSKDPEEKARAQEAKKFVQNLLPVGTDVIIRTQKDKKGKYGRYLADVWHEGIHLTTVLKENKFEK